MVTNKSQYEVMCEVYERYLKCELVPVVRCKECKWREDDRYCGLMWISTDADGFCSNGERKERR